jgi:hypothetical protein
MIKKAMTKLFGKIVTHHKDVFASKIGKLSGVYDSLIYILMKQMPISESGYVIL